MPARQSMSQASSPSRLPDPVCSLILRTITASIGGKSSAMIRGESPRAVPSCSAAAISQPSTVPPLTPPATRTCPPRRWTRSQTCQPSRVRGACRLRGHSAQTEGHAAQYSPPPPNSQSARAVRRFFPHPVSARLRYMWSGRPQRSARVPIGHRCRHQR